MKRFLKALRSLYVQVILAMIFGVLWGHFYPTTALALIPLSHLFIKLIKMVITPIIFCSVALGIASMKNAKNVGKTGGFALLYFEIISTVALLLGWAMVSWIKPGRDLQINVSTLDIRALDHILEAHPSQGMLNFIVNIVPDSAVNAFAQGNILQVLVFSLLFGFALHASGEKGIGIQKGLYSFLNILFGMVNIIMRFAPLGVLAAMAFSVAQHGIESLFSLAEFMGSVYLTCFIFIFFILGGVAKLHGFSIWSLMRYIKEELLIVFSTSSSESVLPRIMLKLEKLGVEKSVVGLVIPTGYSFNLDGTAIYLSMAALFIAQATQTYLDLGQQITLLAVLLFTSKGAAGVTGSGFVVLATTLSAVGHIPVAGLVLILSIDRLMSEARSLTNLVGNTVATLIIGKWCGALDIKRLRQEL